MNITYHDVFGWIAGALMVIGMYPYVRSIVLTKKTKPPRSSYAIWSALGIIGLVAYFCAHERETIWFVAISAINPLIILCLSVRYGQPGWSKTETWCVILAVAAIISWKVTSRPVAAIIFCIIADSLAVYPTWIKIRKLPFTENLTGWSIGLVAGVCNLIAVKEWTWANGIYTSYALSAFGLIVVTLVVGQQTYRAWVKTLIRVRKAIV